MKKYYPGPLTSERLNEGVPTPRYTLRESGPALVIAFFIRAALIFLVIAACAFAFGSMAQGLVFKNPVLEDGRAGKDGAVYRFSNVTNNVDALITISDRSSSKVRLLHIDLASGGHDKAFQPQVTYNNNTTPWGITDWWMEFHVAFVKSNTKIPVNVSEFDITAIDIDGNGSKIKEWVSFYHLKSSVLERNSLLQTLTLLQDILDLLTPIGRKFTGPVDNFTDIDTSATSVMAGTHYENRSDFRLRVGGHSTGSSSAADRMYSFWFKSFSYQQPVESTLPVKLTGFTATKSEAGVTLNWSTSMEKNTSHFVIERSVNGSDYSDIGMLFTEGDSYSNRNYKFVDDLRNVKAQVVYYRLRTTDLDGSYEHSAIRIIRIGSQNEAPAVLAYPNPVTDNLRITFPAAWQDQQVVIEVVSTSGQIVRRIASKKVGQTETVDTSDWRTGIYLVRVSNGSEIATHRIVKK